jgi:hypothetical protein
MLVLTLREGMHVKDGRALADFSTRVLWSVNSREPLYLSIWVMRADGIYENLIQSAHAAGWTTGPQAAEQASMPSLMIFLADIENKRKLGTWPGRVPPGTATDVFEASP